MKKNILVLLTSLTLLATPSVANADRPLPTGDFSKYQWMLDAVHAKSAWTVTKGKGVRVGVIDTGVDATHPDLIDRVVPGWSINSDITDAVGHGTHIAGIIAGNDNGTGITGIAPQATIVPVKVFGSTGGSDQDIANAIDEAIKLKVDVINLSLGATRNENSDTYICDAALRAYNADIVVVAAAGNEGAVGNPQNMPGSCPGVLSVSALTSEYKPAHFTSFDHTVMISAPGAAILSSVPGNSWEYKSGTSMASPVVAGVAALVRARFPNMTAVEIVQQLTSTAYDLGTPGFDPMYGQGMVNAAAAVGLRSSRLAKLVLYPQAVFNPYPSKTGSYGEITWNVIPGVTVNSVTILNLQTSQQVDVPGIQVRSIVASRPDDQFTVTLHTTNGDLTSLPVGMPAEPLWARTPPQSNDGSPIKISGRWEKQTVVVKFNGSLNPSANNVISVVSSHDYTSQDITLTEKDIKAGSITLKGFAPYIQSDDLTITFLIENQESGHAVLKRLFNVALYPTLAGKRYLSITGMLLDCGNKCDGQRVTLKYTGGTTYSMTDERGFYTALIDLKKKTSLASLQTSSFKIEAFIGKHRSGAYMMGDSYFVIAAK